MFLSAITQLDTGVLLALASLAASLLLSLAGMARGLKTARAVS